MLSLQLRGYGFDGEVVGSSGFDSSQGVQKGLVEFSLEMQSVVCVCVCVCVRAVSVCVCVHTCAAFDTRCRNKPFPWRLLQCVAR